MDKFDWSLPNRPYDLRERLFEFACVTVELVKYLHTRGPIAVALSYQLLKSGTSAAANYEESDDGSSPRDTKSKRQISLREMKETRLRLRVLRRTGFLEPVHDGVIDESHQLVRILSAVIRNDSA